MIEWLPCNSSSDSESASAIAQSSSGITTFLDIFGFVAFLGIKHTSGIRHTSRVYLKTPKGGLDIKKGGLPWKKGKPDKLTESQGQPKAVPLGIANI